MRSGRGNGFMVRAAAAAAALVAVGGAGIAAHRGLGRSHTDHAAAAAASGQAPRGVPAAVEDAAAAVDPRPDQGLGPFRRAWVAVPVATVWNHPGTARPEDVPAVSAVPDVARWVKTLSTQQKLGLDDLLATQALLYQPVFVYGHDRTWDHVLVLGQAGSVYPWGVAGWVPAAQLTYAAPPAAAVHMTVTVPHAAVGGLDLSYGTVLPVTSQAEGTVTVALPTGRFQLPVGELREGLLPKSGSAVVEQAEQFLGLPYLWAGMSGFGYDCSGLTYSVYKSVGITLARDAGDQAKSGTPVARTDLRPGDLVFFAFGGSIDHVGIYAGNGMMVDSPHTGAAVELVPLWTPGFSRYYAGARRYL